MTTGPATGMRQTTWTRLFGSLILIVLGIRSTAIQTPSDALLYAASWITILHLAVGAFLFTYLGAHSAVHRLLEVIALICVAVMAWWFTRAAWWCAALAILLAVAVARYILLYRDDHRPAVRAYAREKCWSEMPAILIMTGLAVSFHYAESEPAARYLALLVLAGTTAFAIWMGAIRNIYRRLLSGLRADMGHTPSQDTP